MTKQYLPELYEQAESMEHRFWSKYRGHGFAGRYSEGPGPAERKFPTAQHLRVACYQWLVWMEANPLYVEKSFAYQGEITTHEEPRARALTKASLFTWLKITANTWDSRLAAYPVDGEEYAEVIREIEMIMYQNKFEGASAGIYNAAIIASDLGLTSRISQEINATTIAKKGTAEMSDEELRKELESRGIPVDMLGMLNPVKPEDFEIPEGGFEE